MEDSEFVFSPISYLGFKATIINTNPGTCKMLGNIRMRPHFKNVDINTVEGLTQNFCTHVFEYHRLLTVSDIKI